MAPAWDFLVNYNNSQKSRVCASRECTFNMLLLILTGLMDI